jgi:hypothetical protein
MRARIELLLGLGLCALASSALASQPGQPLDCSDWVFLEPGLSCTVMIPRGHCEVSFPGYDDSACSVGGTSAVDNQSRLITLQNGPPLPSCGQFSPGDNAQIVQYTGGTGSVVAYIAGRCVGSNRADFVRFGINAGAGHGFTFDAVGGRLLIPMNTFCVGYAAGDCPEDYDGDGVPDPFPTEYGSLDKRQIMVISGFATMFDVLQTYTPTLGLGVPHMPEGLGGADHFDTYWGPLTKPIDFTQAHPLQCGYPATPPHVGDYETVTDTLPTPAPDNGYYYLTATTYQGQTRYGRKTTAGKLSGRDPALLPACVNP